MQQMSSYFFTTKTVLCHGLDSGSCCQTLIPDGIDKLFSWLKLSVA